MGNCLIKMSGTQAMMNKGDNKSDNKGFKGFNKDEPKDTP